MHESGMKANSFSSMFMDDLNRQIYLDRRK